MQKRLEDQFPLGTSEQDPDEGVALPQEIRSSILVLRCFSHFIILGAYRSSKGNVG